ncbi:DUF1357 family protein (plasmid) [Borreliella sinica]|uniref:DUF1357 family protein n=1 Tax=Borreliella sinica TaxID=87162 RepID=UPI003AF1B5AD
MAGTDITKIKNTNSNSSSIDPIKDNIVAKSEESASLLDPNFVPINFKVFKQALVNTYKQRRVQVYENLKNERINIS